MGSEVNKHEQSRRRNILCRKNSFLLVSHEAFVPMENIKLRRETGKSGETLSSLF